MTDDSTRNDDLSSQIGSAAAKPRFLEQQQPRPITLGKLRTEDETRLASEIEKLRG